MIFSHLEINNDSWWHHLENQRVTQVSGSLFYIYTVGFPRFEAVQAAGALHNNNGVM